MKALVLSGGTGTRLRPFTHSLPKQLIAVANKPVLLYCLETIRDMGIRDVGIIVGGQVEQIRAVVGDGSPAGVRVTYIPQDSPRGLAHCVSIARGFLGDDDFVMYLGDNLLIGGVAEIADTFREHRPDATVLLTKVDDPRQYGVAELDAEGQVTALVEKPREPRSDLALIGVYFFTPAIHDAVDRIRPSQRGELEITDAIQDLLGRDGTVTAVEYAGYWKDVGDAGSVLECNRVVLDGLRADLRGGCCLNSGIQGEVVVSPEATVIRSQLEGPIIVGPGSVIQDSVIGPHTAIGRDCRISGAGLAESILLDGAVVAGVSGIRESLIGRAAQVRAAATAPCRLLLGDHADAVLPV